MCVRTYLRLHLAVEVLVGSLSLGAHGGAGVIQDAHDSRRSLLLDQLAHHLVVEVRDRFPLDALSERTEQCICFGV